MPEDEKIIELFFKHSEQAIQENMANFVTNFHIIL